MTIDIIELVRARAADPDTIHDIGRGGIALHVRIQPEGAVVSSALINPVANDGGSLLPPGNRDSPCVRGDRVVKLKAGYQRQHIGVKQYARRKKVSVRTIGP